MKNTKNNAIRLRLTGGMDAAVTNPKWMRIFYTIALAAVIGFSMAGCNNPDNPINTGSKTALDTPANVRVDDAGKTAFTLKWNAVSGVDKYELDIGGVLQQVSNSTTSYDLKALTFDPAEKIEEVAPALAEKITEEAKPDPYNITINAANGGTIRTNPQGNATAGTTVTINVSPNSGYTFNVNSLSVTNGADGNAVNVQTETAAGSIGYTFTMPASDVTISGSFTQNSTDGNPGGSGSGGNTGGSTGGNPGGSTGG